MSIDVLDQVQLVALRRIELIQGARQRSQHIHAAVAITRQGGHGGEETPRALRARTLVLAYQQVATGLDAQRLALEGQTLEDQTLEKQTQVAENEESAS